MGQMKFAYRNILTLRCFDQMTYAQITEITGGSEMQAMLLFFRAKQSLKKQLAQNGFKKEHLLPALGLFGAITASSTKPVSAAIVVSSAAAKVSIATAIIGTATSKSCIVAVTAAAIVMSTATTVKVFKNDAGVLRTGSNISNVVSTEAFEQPISLIRSDDPDGSGWKGGNYLNAKQPIVSVSPENLLVGPRSGSNSNLVVILPKDHWLELGFAGEIVDGPGIDIRFNGRLAGKPPRVFITDGAGQEVQIVSAASYQKTNNNCLSVGYDISGLSLPFKPRALRFVGADNEGPWGGAVLWGMWARVRK